MARLAATAREAAERTGGLVDATLAAELAQAGYGGELPPRCRSASPWRWRRRARPPGSAPARRWERLEGDEAAGLVRRPPGLALDSGGLAKGMFADELAATLGAHRSFAIDCAGDLAIGGAADLARVVEVESPFDGEVLHRFDPAHGGVATSGIGRRSWLGADGRPAHHLLDPATGRPAFTGVVQATALAPSGDARRDPRQGRRPQRAAARTGLAALGRRARVRRRLPPRRRARAGPLPRADAAESLAARRALSRRRPSQRGPKHGAAAGAQLGPAEPEGGREVRRELLRRQRAGEVEALAQGAALLRQVLERRPRARCPRRRRSCRGCARGRSSSGRSPGRGRSRGCR